MVDHVVIMAGGAGKRLWPASWGRRPKQFLRMEADRSLFQNTLKRALGLGISGGIWVVTHEHHVEAMVEECAPLSSEERRRINVLAEPASRNTAPALALAASRLLLEGAGNQVFLVMSADHLISPEKAFRSTVKTAAAEARSGYLVAFGLPPREPSTGYGYIEAGEKQGEGRTVVSFKEKPNKTTAETYIASGRHFWNAGIFVYGIETFLDELANCEPAVAIAFEHPDPSWFQEEKIGGLRILRAASSLISRYETCPSISVDYAVMERSRRIRMVEASFDWNDVGSWDVIAELNPPPRQPVYTVQAENNFVFADRPVALCGVNNLIVVAANGRIMVCKRGAAQLVKQAAEEDLQAGKDFPRI